MGLLLMDPRIGLSRWPVDNSRSLVEELNIAFGNGAFDTTSPKLKRNNARIMLTRLTRLWAESGKP